MLVEGESLLNDGTAIVVFNVLLAFALSLAVGGEQPAALPDLLVGAMVDFVRVAVGGLLIGLGLGWLTAQVIARLDDYLIETTLTTVLAFGSYLVAERLHLSGVLAVVAAGIVCGSLGLKGMSPTTRIVLFNFWEYLAFIANSLVFLLIGLDINLPDLLAQLGRNLGAARRRAGGAHAGPPGDPAGTAAGPARPARRRARRRPPRGAAG